MRAEAAQELTGRLVAVVLVVRVVGFEAGRLAVRLGAPGVWVAGVIGVLVAVMGGAE